MGNEVESSVTTGPEKKEKKSKTLLIIIVILLVLLIGTVAGATALLLSRDDSDKDEETVTSNGPTMGYESSVITDEEALQRAIEEMAKSSEGSMVLELNTTLLSSDGETVSCYLANAAENNYDLYFQIIEDESGEMIYQSGLLPIASHIEEFTCSKKLDSGTYSLTIFFIQVEEDHITEHAKVAASAVLHVE